MLRPIPLRHYLATLSDLGFAERDLLLETKINPDAMDDSDYLIDVGQYLGLFENMTRFKSFPGIGIEIGLRSELTDFGILGYAAPSCQSARQSMEDIWIRYGDALGMIAKPRFLSGDAKTVTMALTVPSLSNAAYRLCIEEALCRIAKVGAYVAGEKAAFEQVFLAYPAPEYGERYRDIFQCPIHFNAPHTLAIIKRDWLERPLKTQDEALHGFYLQHLRKIDQHIKSNSPIVDQLKGLLLHCDCIAMPSQAEAAQELGLSARSMSRALQQQGSSYRRVIENVRIERVLKRIGDKIPTKEIAYQAGYHDVNAFRRAFKKWTGGTVKKYLLP